MSSCDVARNICLALVRHVTDMHFAPYFLILSTTASYDVVEQYLLGPTTVRRSSSGFSDAHESSSNSSAVRPDLSTAPAVVPTSRSTRMYDLPEIACHVIDTHIEP
jgi:hypothetical protein